MTRIKDFIPGAEPARAPAPPARDDYELGRPAMIIAGEPCYPISVLADAMNRSNSTIRAWEADGVIPRGYSTEGATRNGNRRLYTRRQILGLRQLAAEYGILDDRSRTVKGSEFSRVTFLLFDSLREETA